MNAGGFANSGSVTSRASPSTSTHTHAFAPSPVQLPPDQARSVVVQRLPSRWDSTKTTRTALTILVSPGSSWASRRRTKRYCSLARVRALPDGSGRWLRSATPSAQATTAWSATSTAPGSSEAQMLR